MMSLGFITMILVMIVSFKTVHFMNVKYEMHKEMETQVITENKNTYLPMGYRLELKRDLTADEDSVSSIKVSIVKAKMKN